MRWMVGVDLAVAAAIEPLVLPALTAIGATPAACASPKPTLRPVPCAPPPADVCTSLRGSAAAAIVRPVKSCVAIVVVLAVLVLGACGGDSKEDEAKAQVCDARADVSKQVDSLKGMTLSTATTSQIRESLTAIGNDLTKIKDAQADLDDQRKSQVQQANQAFESQLKSIRSTLGSTTSLSDAKAQLSQAFQQLASAYEDTLSKIDCG
jgi:hypothetical protein